MINWRLWLPLTVCFALATCSPTPSPESDSGLVKAFLKGVTVKSWPFIDKQNGTYRGFLADLMNEIAAKVGFKYELHFSTDSAYNTDYNYKLFRIVGDVFTSKADFALADLTITQARKRYVDFTEPFLEYQLAAVIRKEDAVGMENLDDLVRHNLELERVRNATKLLNGSTEALVDNGIALSTINSKATIYKLSTSKDPTAVHIYNWMEKHPEAYVRNRKLGLDQVLQGGYAFLVDSTWADYVVGGKCNLTVLHDTKKLYPRQFAIALHKGATHLLGAFNRAIRELKTAGVIERIQSQYWTNKCN